MNKLQQSIAESLKTANIPVNAKLMVGLSGGMDSVVLTHALKALGYDLTTAHLNHCLRGADSDADEAFVRQLSREWELPCISRQTEIPKKGNLEANAREVRYAFLEEARKAHKADYIVVAHHFDDQIETILMHEKRGAGLRGQCGMSLLKGNILRPMLNISWTEIENYAKEHRLEYHHDQTNDDLNFARNHLRHELIPKLRQAKDFEQSIRDKMTNARQKLADLEVKSKLWITENLRNDRFDRYVFAELSKDLQAEILLNLLGQQDIYSKMLGRLMDFIAHGRTGKELAVKDRLFVIEYDQIHSSSREAEELKKTPLKGEVEWGDYHIAVSHIKPLYVRSWKAGDRFRPAGMKGSKKVQDFFTDTKVPRYARKRIPIVVNENDDIICVGAMRFAEDYRHLKANIQIDEK
jgi:tRNA(Ile)-lysidine synthase